MPVHPRVRRTLPRAAVALALSLPLAAGALEPRFDHRDQQGVSVEGLYARDIVWRGSASSSTSSRGALRAAWSFDPAGDGDEILLGGTLAVLEGGGPADDRVRWTIESRYRVTVGTDEFKTLLEVGIWGTAADRFVIGPMVGLGFMYDFNRNIGVLASGFIGVGAGDGRAASFGGGLGFQVRFE
jgi:hypothetical protein